jgi:hypothetical protein
MGSKINFPPQASGGLRSGSKETLNCKTLALYCTFKDDLLREDVRPLGDYTRVLHIYRTCKGAASSLKSSLEGMSNLWRTVLRFQTDTVPASLHAAHTGVGPT